MLDKDTDDALLCMLADGGDVAMMVIAWDGSIQLGVDLHGAHGVRGARVCVAYRGLPVVRDAVIHVLFRPKAKLGRAAIR